MINATAASSATADLLEDIADMLDPATVLLDHDKHQRHGYSFWASATVLKALRSDLSSRLEMVGEPSSSTPRVVETALFAVTAAVDAALLLHESVPEHRAALKATHDLLDWTVALIRDLARASHSEAAS